MTKVLSKFNCTVATTSNGREALSYLSNRANTPPDLIFMDVSRKPAHHTQTLPQP